MTKAEQNTIELLIVIAIIASIQYLPAWHEVLVFDSQRLPSRPWTIVTAHLSHLGWQHALLNITGLILIATIWRQQIQGRLFVTVLFCAVASSLALLVLPWDIRFVGLSGVLHGIAIYALLLDQTAKWRRTVIVLLSIKVLSELFIWQPGHFTGPDVAVIHAAGALSGVTLWMLTITKRKLAGAQS